jgi:tetratricopeptide (TPR) repeat protein
MARRASANILSRRQTRDGEAVDSKAAARRSRRRNTISLSGIELLCAVAIFFVALLLYAWTLAPTVTLTDSGELIVAAHGLGVAHPPGFPFWVMLAHLASLVPWGNVAARINFSSALFAALASAMLTAVVAELLISGSWLASQKRTKKSAQRSRNVDASDRARFLQLAPALAAGLLMAFSRTLWAYATITEVYALNTVLILLVFFLIARWRRRIVESRRDTQEQGTTHDNWLYTAALVFGVALGVHHVTVALTLPAVAVMVYRTQGLKFFVSRQLLYAALISIGGLVAVYSYLPLAASRAPVMNWGNPRSLQEIWWHITGRQYRVFLTFAPAIMGAQFVEFCRMLLREFGFPWLPVTPFLAVAGFANAYKRDRTAFWFLLLIVIADLDYALSYEIAEDKDAYYLPAFISVAIAAGFGVHWLIQWAVSSWTSLGKRRLAVAASILVAPAIAFAGNWPFNNRRQYFIAHDYVENLLSSIRPNGLLLTLDWQVASPMFYAQEIEHRRRDVNVVDINLLRRSWYFDYLRRTHPDLIERSREKVDAFVAKLKEWERNPEAFQRSVALTQGISAAFLEMLQSMVISQTKVASAYMTNDLLFSDSVNGEFTKWLTQNYQLLPEGLVFHLTNDRSFHDLPDVRLETRGLADGTVRFERDDPVNLKVLPAYTSMLINRGRYFAAFNQHQRAVAAFREALRLNPDLPQARQALAENAAKLPNP